MFVNYIRISDFSFFQRCVEFYDTSRDPIKIYFLEKIQKTIANRETLKVLMLNRKTEVEEKEKTKSRKNSTLSPVSRRTYSSSSSSKSSNNESFDKKEEIIDKKRSNEDHFREKSHTFSENREKSSLQNRRFALKEVTKKTQDEIS